jgi:hypothetical protein
MKTNFKEECTRMFIVLTLILISATGCKDDEVEIVMPPTLNNASEITNNSFNASWSAVSGADKYLLDVSTSSTFASFLTGYNKKEITTTSHTVEGLDEFTKYYFRVYAKKGIKVSVASATKEATTLE